MKFKILFRNYQPGLESYQSSDFSITADSIQDLRDGNTVSVNVYDTIRLHISKNNPDFIGIVEFDPTTTLHTTTITVRDIDVDYRGLTTSGGASGGMTRSSRDNRDLLYD